ncbi:hypothetical protein [Clostridium thailandense]|uniref:hypothetical protein n=1 Tax=Clostridium thailandense TaxID=2794346 RepID=UPI003988A565
MIIHKEEWKDSLSEQSKYIKDKYGYDMPDVQESQVNSMNEQAIEAQKFTGYMKDALKSGWKASDDRIQEVLKNHIIFLNSHGHNIDSKSFTAQTSFFVDDDFHRSMLENQQVGLSYYLYTVANMYATSNK